jgi:hypothetical protein
MEPLTDIFSAVCGQGGCLVVDGVPLPVCQRCLGLYIGALLTALWLLVSGLWRRGLPGRGAVAVEAAALATAMLGGLHVLDFGPIWRVLCGLWTGHVVIVWLVGGAAELRALSRPQGAHLPAWPNRARLTALAATPTLAVLGWSVMRLPPTAWWAWALAAALGLASLGTAAAVAVAAVGRTLGGAIRGMVQWPSRS